MIIPKSVRVCKSIKEQEDIFPFKTLNFVIFIVCLYSMVSSALLKAK